MADNFNACEKSDTAPIPPGGMGFVIVPGESNDDYTYFDVVLYHNFEHMAKDLTKEEKTIFLIAQGLIDIAMGDGGAVLERGQKVMERFVKGLGVELNDKQGAVNLENMVVKGHA